MISPNYEGIIIEPISTESKEATMVDYNVWYADKELKKLW
jgi:hypothetical protein